jgi:hypothetical protein
MNDFARMCLVYIILVLIRKFIIGLILVGFSVMLLSISWLASVRDGVIVTTLVVATIAYKLLRHKTFIQPNADSLKTTSFKALAAVLVLLMCLPVFAFGSFVINCQLGHWQSVRDARTQIKKFDQVELAASLPEQKANVAQNGDCIDSEPYVTVTKKYTVNKNGGELLGEVRKSLVKQGFILSNERYFNNGCGYRYDVDASQDKLKLWVELVQSSYNSESCSNTLDNYAPTTEQQFMQASIDTVRAEVK